MIVKGYTSIQEINEAKQRKSLDSLAKSKGFEILPEGDNGCKMKSSVGPHLPARVVRANSDQWVCVLEVPTELRELESPDLLKFVGLLAKAQKLMDDLKSNGIPLDASLGRVGDTGKELEKVYNRLRQLEIDGSDYDDAEPWEMTWYSSSKADPFGLTVSYSEEKGTLTVAVRFFSDISETKMRNWIDRFIKNNGLDKFKTRIRWDYEDAQASEDDGAGSGKGQVYCFVNVTNK